MNRQISFFFISILMVAVGVSAQTAANKLVESSAAPPVIMVDGGSDVNQSWGRPRVLQTYDGWNVMLYAQGIPNLTAPTLLDQIWLFKNENDTAGWNSIYNLGTKKRILPMPTPLPAGVLATDPGVATSHNYPHHWPYKLHNRYYMVAQDIDGAPTAANFKYFILGWSNDGVDWRWRRFLRVRDGMSLDQMTWKDVTIGTVKYLFGFVSGTRDGGGIGTAAIRFRQDGLSGGTWGYDDSSTSTALSVWAGGQWVTVPTCATVQGDTSGYNFCLYRDKACATPGGTCPTSAQINPDWILPGVRHPSLHKLTQHNNTFELWYGTTVPDQNCGCDDNATAENNNVFEYRSVDPPTNLTDSPLKWIASTPRQVGMDSPKVRCMPADYKQSRLHPFRLDWTADVVYSRTGDSKGSSPDACSTTGWSYIVRTKLKAVPTP